MTKPGRPGRPKKISSDNLIDSKRDQPMKRSDKLPEFFKIYTPSLCSESIRIPPEFIKQFGKEIPSIVTLKRPSGVSWRVHMSRTEDHWFFQKGWREFVQENSLEDGDFLTFCYAGNSTFGVKIFGTNGCRKREDDHAINWTENIQEKEESQPGQHKEESEPDQVKEESEPEDCKNNIGASTREFIARKSDCKNPSFSVIMTKFDVRRKTLT